MPGAPHEEHETDEREGEKDSGGDGDYVGQPDHDSENQGSTFSRGETVNEPRRPGDQGRMGVLPDTHAWHGAARW